MNTDAAEAALGRVADLAETWTALAIPGTPDDVAAEVDAYCGQLLLDVIHGPSGADVRQEIDQLDNYIRQLSQAATDADIDRLEQLKEQKRWDGSSSR